MEYSLFSEKGIREENQDAVFAATEGDTGVFALADGMGGHSDGEHASKELITAVSEWWKILLENKETLSAEEVFTQCNDLVARVNKELRSYYKDKNLVGGSTIVILIVWKGTIRAISVGDSRLYLVKKGKVVQISLDDVWENSIEVRKCFSESELMHDERRGKLVAAVGVFEQVEIHDYFEELFGGDTFFLCSDGVYRYCDEEKLEKIFKNPFLHGVGQKLNQIRKHVEKQGTNDNYSAIICKV